VHSEKLLDHFANPRNAGEVLLASHIVERENPACGDQLRLSVRIEAGRIAAAGFQTRGCAASIGCSSALTELLLGRSRTELAEVRAPQVEAAVGGLIAESKHAAVLCADAVKALEAAWKLS
jgi:NifU-like protein involved in Fe-S cluster formation